MINISARIFRYPLLLAFTGFVLILAPEVTGAGKSGTYYREVGITTTIMTTHPSVGFGWHRYSTRLTGMYLGADHYEFHINFGYAFADTGPTQHGVNLLTSWIAGSDPGADYKYAATGLAYSYFNRGFFAELGLAIPWQDQLGNLADDPVVPCGYFGYLFRF